MTVTVAPAVPFDPEAWGPVPAGVTQRPSQSTDVLDVSGFGLDDTTVAVAAEAGWAMDDVPPRGTRIRVRRTANLHTGGTIEDGTARLHPEIVAAAVRASRAIDIPVTGLDFLVPDLDGAEQTFIEANERPGLANHQPQPTAERFIDLLFPETARH